MPPHLGDRVRQSREHRRERAEERRRAGGVPCRCAGVERLEQQAAGEGLRGGPRRDAVAPQRRALGEARAPGRELRRRRHSGQLRLVGGDLRGRRGRGDEEGDQEVRPSDPAEVAVLWRLRGVLDAALVEPFRSDYRDLVASARRRITEVIAPITP